MEEKRGRERTNGRRREGPGRGQTEAFGGEVGLGGRSHSCRKSMVSS